MKRLTLVLSLLASALLSTSVPAATPRPNFVVILADDLGYGDVQCLNPRRGKIPTPHLDRLAREGMTFTDAHSGSSVCTPTRYGLLTGRYAWRTRLERGVIDGFVPPLIDADRLTLPAHLKRQGYHSAAIGKWHLGFTLDRQGAGAGQDVGSTGAPIGARTDNGPVARGFDLFYGVQHARSMGTFFLQDKAVEQVPPVDALDKLSSRAVDYIMSRAKSGQPFFLYFALTSPHTPIVPSAEWKGRSGLGPYADFVMQTDAAVGEVLRALEEAGVAETTLVLATSDNGCSPQAGTDELERRGHFASAQFRGYKTDIWEGGHRVPFLVRWPGRVAPGSQSDVTLCLTDVMATLAEIVEEPLPPTAAEDSHSFLAALCGARSSVRPPVIHHSFDGKFAIRSGVWKLALCAGSGGWGKDMTDPVQLYDLSADIAEQRNLAPEEPAVVGRLRDQLARAVRDGRTTEGPAVSNDRVVTWAP
ncbi:MAG: arylsulfatase [Opitutaceae bacterium]|nr:arylsulfatase [Opitutaceae bacterium]